MLEQSAQDTGGELSIEQVRALAETFKQAPGKLAAFYKQTFEDCSGGTLQQAHPKSEIRNPYRQLLIAEISAGLNHNLAINHGNRSAAYSPRLLKAFVKSRERLMPRRFVTRAHARAVAIEARLREGPRNQGFSWEAYCRDPEARELIAETVDQLCDAFQAFGKQTEFLIAEVNSQLGNVRLSDGSYMPGTPVVFGERQFRRALKVMLEESCREPAARAGAAKSKPAQIDDEARARIRTLYRHLARIPVGQVRADPGGQERLSASRQSGNSDFNVLLERIDPIDRDPLQPSCGQGPDSTAAQNLPISSSVL